jgi:hypothetical protein
LNPVVVWILLGLAAVVLLVLTVVVNEWRSSAVNRDRDRG